MVPHLQRTWHLAHARGAVVSGVGAGVRLSGQANTFPTPYRFTNDLNRLLSFESPSI